MRLYELHGGPTRIANLLGLSSSSYLSQLASGHRPIKEGRARSIEKTLTLPDGWMDTKHESSATPPAALGATAAIPDIGSFVSGALAAAKEAISPSPKPAPAPALNLVSDTVMSVGSMLQEAGLDVSPSTFAHILDLVLANAQANGALNEEFLRKIIALVSTLIEPNK